MVETAQMKTQSCEKNEGTSQAGETVLILMGLEEQVGWEGLVCQDQSIRGAGGTWKPCKVGSRLSD